MKTDVQPVRFRPVFLRFRHRPGLAYVNKGDLRPALAPQAISQIVPATVADGFIHPRPGDTVFDVTVRVPSIAVSSTVTQTVFTQEEGVKAGWIRYLGYGFNNPHGFFQVRTSILVNGAVPSGYLFKTVEATSGAYQGSFPPVQIGTISEPASVFIALPSSARVEVRFVNNSAQETFSCVVRLVGWGA